MRTLQSVAGAGLALLLACDADGGDANPGGSSSGGSETGTGMGSDETGSVSTAGGSTGGPSGSTETSDATGAPTSSGGQDTSGDSTGSGVVDPPFEDVRNYIFGHSLLLHSPTANVPRWLDGMADAAGYGYSMSGQYGFADTHADNLPPIPQWGIEGVDVAWSDDDGQAFEDIDFNTVLFTEANFRQYFPPTEPEPDLGGPTSVQSTLAVFDWVDAAEPGVRFIVYENWPDMAPFTDADFGSTMPTEDELAAYWAFTRGDFHQWWLDYHDALQAQRPDLTIHMVSVGPILGGLLTGPLSDIPPEVLYEDDAPHGRESLYLLAGLATWMSIYASPPPASYVPPEEIDSRIRDRWPEVVDFVWAEVASSRAF